MLATHIAEVIIGLVVLVGFLAAAILSFEKRPGSATPEEPPLNGRVRERYYPAKK